MKEDAFHKRFKDFAIAIIRFTRNFPEEQEYWTIKKQITDSATSAAANYRATKRAKSDADFANKLKIVEEELDETMFWLELTVGVSDTWRTEVAPLYREADELLAIVVSSIKTTKNKIREKKSRNIKQ
jgi:four helix bundle protein